MKKYTSIIILYLFLSFSSVTYGQSNPLTTALESEIRAVIKEKTLTLELAQKKGEYLTERKTQDREIESDELAGIYENISIIHETVNTDIESLLEETKVFLGVENATLPVERGALDSARIARARNLYYDLFRMNNNPHSTTPIAGEDHEKILEHMIQNIRLSIRLSNHILRIVEKSIEQIASEEYLEPASLDESRETYREFRSMFLEHLDSLNEVSNTIESLDDEKQIGKKYDIEILTTQQEEIVAYAALKKAERMLIELNTNGTISTENF